MKLRAPEPLKDGLEGTEQLVEHITRLIREGGRRADVRELALEVVRLARPQDTTDEIQKVWDYLTSIAAPPYRMDPVELQLLTFPEAIRSIKGVDCKKFTIIAGALLESIGIPVKVRVIDQRRQQSEGGALYHHVYLQVFNKDRGRWVSFDPVAKSFRRPDATVGTELNHKARRTYMIRPATQLVSARGGYVVASPQAVGGVFDFLDSVANTIYSNVIKPFDPTRPENAGVRAVFNAIPGGSAVVALADGAAAAKKAAAPAPVATTTAPKVTSRTTAPVIARLAPQVTAKLATKAAPAVSPQKLTAPGMSTGTKVAIGVGIAAALGVGIALATRKPKRRANPRRRAKRAA